MKKKLFISCPMKGRTEENIRKSMEKLHRIAEVIFDQELEVIQSYIEHTPPETTNQAIWYLGESIKKMADADYFIGVDSYGFRGCYIELSVARNYNIPYYMIDREIVAPDLLEEGMTCIPSNPA